MLIWVYIHKIKMYSDAVALPKILSPKAWKDMTILSFLDISLKLECSLASGRFLYTHNVHKRFLLLCSCLVIPGFVDLIKRKEHRGSHPFTLKIAWIFQDAILSAPILSLLSLA